MMNQIDQAFYRSKRQNGDKINIMWFPYDGMFEYLFGQFDFINHIYYNKHRLYHEWKCDEWPLNFNLFGAFYHIDHPIDVCIANSRQTQALNLSETSKSIHSPLVVIDHEPPAEGAKRGLINHVNKKMPQNAEFVATHQIVKDGWLYDSDNIIEYGFKLCDESVDKDNDFIFIGDYSEDDVMFSEMIKSMVPGIKTCGHNRNTEPFSSMSVLIKNLQDTRVSISASSSSKPPLLQILSASQNCLVLTSANRWTEAIFENGSNALLYYSIDDLRAMIQHLNKGSFDIDQIVKNARDMINEKFNFDRSQLKWRNFLTEISNRTFII